MALTVVTDPLSSLCNSYASIAQADLYAADRATDSAAVTAWQALNAASKAKYLVNASRALDDLFDWIGHKYFRDQGMKWPRYDAWVEGYALEVAIIPPKVTEAAIEFALWYTVNSGAVSVGQNIQYDSIKVGPLNIDFNEDAGGAREEFIPDVVAMILRDYGTATDPNVPGSKQVKLVRLVRA